MAIINEKKNDKSTIVLKQYTFLYYNNTIFNQDHRIMSFFERNNVHFTNNLLLLQKKHYGELRNNTCGR